MFVKGDKVRIVAGFCGAGRSGIVVGGSVEGRDYRYWIPVLFDDEDDPDFFKDGGLEKVKCDNCELGLEESGGDGTCEDTDLGTCRYCQPRED